ncbi:MAG: NUDIX domain-containing protein [Oscillospiraceae bacterium]|nr:NUDIX domain-containing protein [Oscillospiraceae bacterium]
MNNKFFTVCGIIEINGKILLVRHTYGTAKDRILLPGGYVTENELPTTAAEREILEETGVNAAARSLMAMQFKSNQWCAVFIMDYLSGTPKSDGHENSEVLLLTAEEAVKRVDITNMSRQILTAYMNGYYELRKSEYVPASAIRENYVIFGV